MAKDRKSESLFGEAEQNLGDKTPQLPPAITPEEDKKIRAALKADYIFKDELKDGLKDLFDQEIHRTTNSTAPAAKENKNVVQQLNQMREVVSRDENIVLRRSNERRKRHYALNGEIKVYCYVLNQWPKMIVKPLTISIDENYPIPPLGPFVGQDEFLVETIFDPITVGIKRKIDPFVFEPMSENSSKLSVNSEEHKRLSFSLCFKRWNIPISLEKENGMLSEESMNIINHHLHPKLFDVISREFVALNEVSEEETKALDKQCDRLFAKKSLGVGNPLEGVRLYCEASAFAKEFALSGKSLEDLSVRVATLIRHVSQKGAEIHARDMDTNKGSAPKRAKVIGKGR